MPKIIAPFAGNPSGHPGKKPYSRGPPKAGKGTIFRYFASSGKPSGLPVNIFNHPKT